MIRPNFVESFPPPLSSASRQSPRKKRILLISGGSQGKMAEYRQIHQQGIKIVVLDAPNHWAKICRQTGLVEAFIEVDLTERASLFDEVIDALMNSGLLFDDIIAFSDSAEPLAARLAYAMGLTNDFNVTRQ